MLTFAYVPCAPQFPFGGDVSVILPMRSSAGTPGGARNWAGSRLLKPVPCSIAPESLTGIFRPIVPNAAESARPKCAEFSGVRAYSVCGYTSPSRWPSDHFLHVSRTAASLSVEGSRLARRPPRKRREAAFTPRSETTLGTGLNSSGRDDIQTMDRQVFGLLFVGAMERKTGLSKWPILYRIVAAQFRGFGLAR
jgi:hypothetical protein